MKNRVFVVGSLHYDIVLNAPHLPARDETVIGDNVQFVCGGKGGNQAVSASQHGATVNFAGAVGDDFFADVLLENLAKAGVETSGIVRTGSTASGMSVAIVDAAGDYGAVVASGANQTINGDHIKLPQDTGLLLLQNEISEAVNIHLAQQARQHGTMVVLNAAPMREISNALLQLVDVLIVNRVEAEALFGETADSSDSVVTLLDAQNDKDGLPQTIIVTLGGEGLVYVDRNRQPQYMAAHNVAVISSHGAGDAFCGALSARLAQGDRFSEALTYASAAGALHVSTPVEKRNAITERAVMEML